MLTSEANPQSGFTDASDPDYPGMDTCLYCLYGDEVQNVCSGGASANTESSQSPESSLGANEIVAFTTCHSAEFDRTTGMLIVSSPQTQQLTPSYLVEP